MATIDQFRWPLAAGGEVKVMDRSRSNEFGDGARQSVIEGINPFLYEFPCQWTGTAKVGNQIIEFLKAHITTPFKIIPPHGELMLVTVKSGTISYRALGRMTMTVSFEVKQAVGIYTGLNG
ncbi:tail protein [Enterobacter phage ATCEA85]|nr:tail protein [Enterobacter phage ATCEA85]UVX30841.1 minor tail protein [Klebsiella phage VLCpiS8a]